MTIAFTPPTSLHFLSFTIGKTTPTMAPTPDTISANDSSGTDAYYKTEETQYTAMSHAGVAALAVFIVGK